MKTKEIEKHTSLIEKKENIENTIKELSEKITKKCEHGKEKAYFFPLPLICFDCAIQYYKHCKKNNLLIDEVLYREVKEYIEKEEIEKKKAQALQQKEYRKVKKQEKFFSRSNQLDNYKNKTNLTPNDIGLRYERYIGYLFEMKGYDVKYHGATKGKNDGGIDIIASSKNVIYLIQCKRYSDSHKVHENTINQLIGTLSTYKREFNNTKTIKALLYTVHDNLDNNARKALSLHPEIQHIVKQYDKDYPMIKCNISNNNEKIYHLPDDASYDRIKIELKKKEFYCSTEEEAITKGFRRTKK